MNENLAPAVAILMCTYRAGRYLREQLDSFASQSHANWTLWVSDDGSDDETLDILERFRAAAPRNIVIVRGPRRGYVANFLSLACRPEIEADYYAFSDQDDVWDPHKLEHAVKALAPAPAALPALYCSRTTLIDTAGRTIGLSPLFRKPPSFENALVQNIGGGNTMVFNRVTRQLLREAGAWVDPASHDWWLYTLVTGCGGSVFYDPAPSLRYRQHDANLVGAGVGWLSRLSRLRLLIKGRFKRWNDRNLAALGMLEPKLTDRSRQALELFRRARQQPLLTRLTDLRRSGAHRQTIKGNLALWIGAILGKI